MFSNKIYQFYTSLKPPSGLPVGIDTLYPQKDPSVMKLVKIFLQKYFFDNNKRILVLGINPGRFGAGATGINFTAARQLRESCRIDHPLKDQSELSAEFIYEVIERYGGPAKFYGDFFLSSVSPLGFTREKKNLNYYDDKDLQVAVTPFIESCINHQYGWHINKHTCICIGGEKNFNFLTKLNNRHNWFQKILPLPHPRFVLQYRRKQKKEYIKMYLDVLEEAKRYCKSPIQS
jgi:hypothetical protein